MQIKIKVRSKSLDTNFSIQITSNFNKLSIKKEQNKIQTQNYQVNHEIFRTPQSLQKCRRENISYSKISQCILTKNAPNQSQEDTQIKSFISHQESVDESDDLQSSIKIYKNDQLKQYQDQILQYLKSKQQIFQFNPNSIINSLILSQVRKILIKQIFKTCKQFDCKRKTIHFAVYCLDFYLSKNPNLSQNQLILLTKACLHIAMKFQQIYPPSINRFTINEKQQEKVIYYEAKILKSMNFILNYPSIVYFEQHFASKFYKKSSQQNHQLRSSFLDEFHSQKFKQIQLIGDLSLFDAKFYKYAPFDIQISIFRIVYEIQSQQYKNIAHQIRKSVDKNSQIVCWLHQKMQY